MEHNELDFWFAKRNCHFHTLTLDRGEFRSLAGEFNKLREVPQENVGYDGTNDSIHKQKI